MFHWIGFNGKHVTGTLPLFQGKSNTRVFPAQILQNQLKQNPNDPNFNQLFFKKMLHPAIWEYPHDELESLMDLKQDKPWGIDARHTLTTRCLRTTMTSSAWLIDWARLEDSQCTHTISAYK